MNLKSMDLAWITVNDVKEAIKFYTETVGLKLMEFDEKMGWAELGFPGGGAKLGIAQTCPKNTDDQPGQNAILTFTVKDLDIAIADMLKKEAKLIGEVLDIPGHVKMQTVSDQDGNRFQLVQVFKHSCAHC